MHMSEVITEISRLEDRAEVVSGDLAAMLAGSIAVQLDAEMAATAEEVRGGLQALCNTLVADNRGIPTDVANDPSMAQARLRATRSIAVHVANALRDLADRRLVDDDLAKRAQVVAADLTACARVLAPAPQVEIRAEDGYVAVPAGAGRWNVWHIEAGELVQANGQPWWDNEDEARAYADELNKRQEVR